MTAATVACLGKLPVHGDFVRLNQTQVPEVVEFDAWLLDGMERAYAGQGRAFDTELRSLPALRFLYTSRQSGRLLTGVVLPSVDQVGRAYPFVAGFALPAVAPGPAFDRQPLQGQPAFTAITALVSAAAAGGASLPAFLEGLQTVAFATDDNEAERTLRGFLLGATLDALCADWPGGHAAEVRLQCLADLRQMCQPPFPPRYPTIVPSRGEPGEVCFWLTLLRQWLAVRANPTLVCWPLQATSRGPIRILFDDLHGRYFEPMFWPDRSTQLLDLGRTASRLRGREAPDPAIAALVRPRLLLQDVILGAARA